MTQGWNFYNKNQWLNPKDISINNMSNYQRMLANTDPTIADPYKFEFTQGSNVSPKVVKKTATSLPTQLQRNVTQTGKGIAKGGKIAAKGASKAMPFVGAGVSVYDAGRSFQIANNMEKINSIRPGTFDDGAIEYYRNKGKAIAAMSGVGALGGAVLGSGVLSAPGAAAGLGVGGAVGDLGYSLFQMNNPYKDTWENTPTEIKDLLYNKRSGDNISSSSTQTTSNTAIPNGQPDFEYIDDNALTGGKSIPQGGNNSLPNLPSIQQGTKLSNIANPRQQQPVATNEQQLDNLQAINDYISKLQTIQQPYIDALQNYLDNYQDLYNKQQLSTRRARDISAITGSPLWYQSARDYNPLTAEVDKLNTIKTIQDAQAGNLNAINEVMGNMAIAKDLGLPYETAFANKNLLTALTANRKNLTDWEKALLAAELKKYGYDIGYNKAINVQGMRGDTARDVARINAAAYSPMVYQPAPGLNQQGSIPTLNQTILQPQNNKYSELDARLRQAEGR